MNIDNLTLGEIKKLQSLFSKETTANLSGNHPYRVGDKYLIRTVTHYYTGKLEAVHDKELLLSSAAWIADTRRYNRTLRDGFPDDAEIEPIRTSNGYCVIGRGAIVDAVIWERDLPMEEK